MSTGCLLGNFLEQGGGSTVAAGLRNNGLECSRGHQNPLMMVNWRCDSNTRLFVVTLAGVGLLQVGDVVVVLISALLLAVGHSATEKVASGGTGSDFG